MSYCIQLSNKIGPTGGQEKVQEHSASLIRTCPVLISACTIFNNRANEEAANAGHKIVSGAHVLKALEAVDLEEMLPRLTEELQGTDTVSSSMLHLLAVPFSMGEGTAH